MLNVGGLKIRVHGNVNCTCFTVVPGLRPINGEYPLDDSEKLPLNRTIGDAPDLLRSIVGGCNCLKKDVECPLFSFLKRD